MSAPGRGVLATAMAVVCLCGALARADLGQWKYTMQVRLPGYSKSETLVDFPLLVVFTTNRTPEFSYSQFASPLGRDLRFAGPDGGVELPYEIEKWNAGGDSYVWVKVPALTNGACVWAYWGNTGAVSSVPAYTTNGAAWDMNYRGVWHLGETNIVDDGTGGTHQDATANRNTGAQYRNGPASGWIGGAQNFDGLTDYIDMGSPSSLDCGPSVTMMAWVRPTTLATYDAIYAKCVYNSAWSYIFSLSATAMYAYDGGVWRNSGAAGLTAGTWQHVAYRKQGGNLYYFRNGRQYTTSVFTHNESPSYRVYLGTYGNTTVDYDGILDEVRISAIACSSNYIWASWLSQASNSFFCAYSNLPVRAVNLDHRSLGMPIVSIGGRAYGRSNGWQNAKGYICWGTSDGGTTFGGWSSNVLMGTNFGRFDSFRTNITVLTNVQYYYRCYVTNALGEDWSDVASAFRMNAPSVNNNWGATNIGSTDAWLVGNVQATNGAATRVWICWGRGDGGTNTNTWANVMDAGYLEEGMFSRHVTGLQANAPYYYRICVNNGWGGLQWSPARRAFKTGPWTLTFVDYFDDKDLGNIEGQNGWTVLSNDWARIQTAVTHGGSLKACSITNTTLRHDFADIFATNEVWADFCARPVFADLDVTATNASVAFCVHTSGYVKVRSGAMDLLLTNGPVLNSNTWVHFTIRSDYQARRWDMYINDVIVRTNMYFRDMQKTNFTRIEVQEASLRTNSYFDSLLLSRFSPMGLAWGSMVEIDSQVRTNSLLPFTDTFESYSLGSIHGVNKWVGSTNSLPVVQTAVRYGGSKAVRVSNGYLYHSVSNMTATNVWMDCYVYASRHERPAPPDVDTDAAAAFYVNRDGYLVVLSNTAWVAILTNQIPSNTWQRFTVKMDYANQRWDLYKAGAVPNDTAVLMARNMEFYAPGVTSVRSWGFKQKNSLGYVDDVGVATSPPACIDEDRDGMSDAWEVQFLGSTNYAAAADNDGDGVSNYREYLAGTVPTNVASYLRMTEFDLPGEASTDLRLSWLGGNARVVTPFSSVGDREGRRFLVQAVDNDAADPMATRATVAASGSETNTWTDSGAVLGRVARYYKIAVTYAGGSYTNPQEWALHVQPRVNKNLYMVGVPVAYGTNSTLKNMLGTHLARGLYPSSSTATADRIFFRTTNSVWKEFYYVTNAAGEAMWWDYDTDTNAEWTVTPVTGIWVDRRSGSPRVRTNTVFTGLSHTSSPPINITTNGAASGWAWNVFAWPFSAADKQVNSGIGPTPPDQLGFEWMAHGGQTMDAEQPHDRKGDQLWVWESNNFRRVYWLMGGVSTNHDGRWWSDRDGSFGNVRLEAGKAYFYRHHVGTNGTVTGTNFIWQPVP